MAPAPPAIYQRPSRGPLGPSELEVCDGVMTLGWFAISGRGASTILDVGSGVFAAGGWVGVADGALVAVEGGTVSRPGLTWA